MLPIMTSKQDTPQGRVLIPDDLSSEQRRTKVIDHLLGDKGGSTLRGLIDETFQALESACNRGRRWIITFSGGKDSTTVLVLAIEALRHRHILGWGPEQVDVIFSDTLLEIPPLLAQAHTLLLHVNTLAEIEHLPIKTHTVMAPIEQRFWFNILGKGYPPPHNRFRWCTDRLKINPSEKIIRAVSKKTSSVLLTGVRYGESDSRTGRMNAACSKSGECGQGVWLDRSERLNTDYLAPIATWTTCKIWDFLSWAAPRHGWPTQELAVLYGDDPIRFGCWTCPLVKEDKATAALVQREEWAHLAPLLQFREKLISVGRSRNPDDRLIRPDGKVGKLSLARRQELYQELIALESKVGIILLDKEEATQIEQYWKSKTCLDEINGSLERQMVRDVSIAIAAGDI